MFLLGVEGDILGGRNICNIMLRVDPWMKLITCDAMIL